MRDADRLAGAGIERIAIRGPSRGSGCRVPDTGRGLGFVLRDASGIGGDPPPRESPPGPGAWCEVDRTFGLVNRVREPGASLWSGGQGQAVLLGGSAARSRESASPCGTRRWLHRVRDCVGDGTGWRGTEPVVLFSRRARATRDIRRSCLTAVAARSLHRLQRRRERALGHLRWLRGWAHPTPLALSQAIPGCNKVL